MNSSYFAQASREKLIAQEIYDVKNLRKMGWSLYEIEFFE